MDKKPQLFTTFRTIKIDGVYTGNEQDMEKVIEEAVTKVINDARAHMHTIENKIQITEITDQGETL